MNAASKSKMAAATDVETCHARSRRDLIRSRFVLYFKSPGPSSLFSCFVL